MKEDYDRVGKSRGPQRLFRKRWAALKADAIDENTLAKMDAVDKAVVGDILGRDRAPKAEHNS